MSTTYRNNERLSASSQTSMKRGGNTRTGVGAALLLASTLVLGSESAAQSTPYPLRVVPDVGMAGAEVRVMTIDPTLVYGVDWEIYGAYASVGWAAQSWFFAGFVPLTEPIVWVMYPPGAGPGELGTFGPFSSFGTITPPFYFMDATAGRVETIGRATTLSTGDRPVIYWDLDKGDPSSGNSMFTPRLGLAPPGAIPFLVMSPPVEAPYRLLGDGELVVDLANPYLVLVGCPVGGLGDSEVLQPLPNLSGVTVHAQWGFIDPGTNRVAVSNGLRFEL